MGLEDVREVNGTCSTAWYQLCSVASYKRLSTLQGVDGICALWGSGGKNKVYFSLCFLL